MLQMARGRLTKGRRKSCSHGHEGLAGKGISHILREESAHYRVQDRALPLLGIKLALTQNTPIQYRASAKTFLSAS